MTAFIIDSKGGLLVLIALVFVLLVVIGFLRGRATSHGKREDGDSKSDST
jgi:hypothetical protein